jgi:putative glutamine amidotransferase
MKRFYLLTLITLFFITPALKAEFKPLIGISPSFSKDFIKVDADYAKCVEKAGGIPIIIPTTSNPETIKHYVKILDGLLMTGGPDIPPEIYGQERHPSTKVMETSRSESDKALITYWLKTKKPMLGICLGMQFTNVLAGGTLFQDIPTMIGKKVCHRNGERFTNYHSIGISPGSLLHKILGTTRGLVLSRHHQSVDKVGKNLEVIARTSDGVIEALQRTDAEFGLYLQWHPEGMAKFPQHQQKIFKALVEASKKELSVPLQP